MRGEKKKIIQRATFNNQAARNEAKVMDSQGVGLDLILSSDSESPVGDF